MAAACLHCHDNGCCDDLWRHLALKQSRLTLTKPSPLSGGLELNLSFSQPRVYYLRNKVVTINTQGILSGGEGGQKSTPKGVLSKGEGGQKSTPKGVLSKGEGGQKSTPKGILCGGEGGQKSTPKGVLSKGEGGLKEKVVRNQHQGYLI